MGSIEYNETPNSEVTIQLNANNSTVTVQKGNRKLILNGEQGENLQILGSTGFKDFSFTVEAFNNTAAAMFVGRDAAAVASSGKGTPGSIFLRDDAGNDSIILDARITTQDNILVRDDANKRVLAFDDNAYNSSTAALFLGAPAVDKGNKPGSIFLRDDAGNDSIILDAKKTTQDNILVRDDKNMRVFAFDDNAFGSTRAGLFIGAPHVDINNGGKPGAIYIRNNQGYDSIVLDGRADTSGSNSILIRDSIQRTVFCTENNFNNNSTGLFIGVHSSQIPAGTIGKGGFVRIRNNNGNDSIVLDGIGSWMGVHDTQGKRAFAVYTEGMTSGTKPVAWLAVGKPKDVEPTGGGKAGIIVVQDDAGENSIFLDGTKGDIVLANADCAEEFDISSSELSQIEPGTVMVIDNDGRLQVSSKPYDKRVAGVISGGGNLKPGIVLDKKKSQNVRAPLAMLGKVFCKVVAEQWPIKVGDMLTTSNTPGHAMKATNRSRAFGAVIGKALEGLKKGKSLIPILIALQ